MEIQINDASLFRKSIEALRDFLPQAQMHITPKGLSIRGMDSTHVGFVDYFLSEKDCKIGNITNDIVIGISTGILSKVLVAASEKLTLSLKGTSLKVSFQSEGRSATYELPTLDIIEDALIIPEMSYSATIKAKACDVVGVFKDLAIFGDEVSLCLDDEGFHVYAEGDIGKGEQILEPTDDRDMSLEGDSVKISFGMKYMQHIIKSCSSLSPIMEIAFDSSFPLRVSTRFGKDSYFIAFLAPKIKDDE